MIKKSVLLIILAEKDEKIEQLKTELDRKQKYRRNCLLYNGTSKV